MQTPIPSLSPLTLSCLVATLAAQTLAGVEQEVRFPRDFSPTASWVHPAERPARMDLCLSGRWSFQPVAVPQDWKSGMGLAPELTPPQADRWEATPIKIPSPWNVNTWGGGRQVGEGTTQPYAPSSLYFPSYPATWDGVRMGWLRKSFTLAPEWRGRRVRIHFEAIAGEAQILVNGKLIGRHFDQHLPGEFDITDALKADGTNELLVGVRQATLFNRDDPHYAKMHTVLPLGSNTDQLVGIWQDVWLVGVPTDFVSDAFVKPWVDRDRLEVDVTVDNASDKPMTSTLDGVVRPWINDAGSAALDAPEPKSHLGDAVLKFTPTTVTVPAHASATVTISAMVQGRLKFWTPTNPNLYGAVVSLDGGRDRKYVRFGWRQFTLKGKDLLLNGERIQCFGDLLHPFGPFVTSRRFAWGWYRMIKDVGGNAVRPHAQPWPQCYYDLADEMGLMVVAETGIFGSSIALNFAAEETWKNYDASLDRLVMRQRNNPSVIGWSFGNELFAIFRLNEVNAEDSARWHARIVELGKRPKRLDPTRDWISCDGDEDLEGALPIWSKHYGHNVPDLPAMDKIQMVGESGGTYYAAPKLMAAFNGDRAYESYAGRVEALAIDAYQNITQLARPKLAYYSTSELAWFGIEHLALGYRDTTRLPRASDGIFAGKPYEDGKPGMQLERIPPYVSTINPGWDPTLPLYRPLAMFAAMKAALDPAGPQPSPWAERKVETRAPAIARTPTISAVGFAGDRAGLVYRRLRSLGVPFTDSDNKAVLVVDGTTADADVTARAKRVTDAGGMVLLIAGAGVKGSALTLLPAGVVLHERQASQLVAVPGQLLAAGFTVPSLGFFVAEKNPQVIQRVVTGPGVFTALRPSNTDWSLFNHSPEVVKCAAMVLYETVQKPDGAAVGTIVCGVGRLVVVTIDPANSEQVVNDFWAQFITNCGIKRDAGGASWLLPAAATPGAIAEWKWTATDPGATWAEVDFSDGDWATGRAGFGSPVPGAVPGTSWLTSDLWLRRSFTVGARPTAATVVAYWDEDAEIWINGVRVMSLPGFSVAYKSLPLSAAALQAIHPGNNVIAIHCQNRAGGQFIDVGILEAPPGGDAKPHDLLLDGPLAE